MILGHPQKGARCALQVSAAYSVDHSVQRNNFSLIKAFAFKWPTLPPPPDALLPHIQAGGPQAVGGAKGRLSWQFADRRLFGLRLASAGMQYSDSARRLHLLSCMDNPSSFWTLTSQMLQELCQVHSSRQRLTDALMYPCMLPLTGR